MVMMDGKMKNKKKKRNHSKCLLFTNENISNSMANLTFKYKSILYLEIKNDKITLMNNEHTLLKLLVVEIAYVDYFNLTIVIHIFHLS